MESWPPKDQDTCSGHVKANTITRRGSRNFQNGRLSTWFHGLVKVECKKAKGIYSAVKSAFDEAGVWDNVLRNLMCLVSDGASVMTGINNGVATLT